MRGATPAPGSTRGCNPIRAMQFASLDRLDDPLRNAALCIPSGRHSAAFETEQLFVYTATAVSKTPTANHRRPLPFKMCLLWLNVVARTLPRYWTVCSHSRCGSLSGKRGGE